MIIQQTSIYSHDATLEVLAKQIDDAVQHFVHEVLQVNDNVKFRPENSWVNRHAKGEHNTLHWHSNAMLSGVYYVDSAEGAGDIVFQNPSFGITCSTIQ